MVQYMDSQKWTDLVHPANFQTKKFLHPFEKTDHLAQRIKTQFFTFKERVSSLNTEAAIQKCT